MADEDEAPLVILIKVVLPSALPMDPVSSLSDPPSAFIQTVTEYVSPAISVIV